MAELTIFTQVVQKICKLYKEDPNKDLMLAWAQSLRGMTDQQLIDGYDVFIKEYDSNFMPVPAVFKKYCPLRDRPFEIPSKDDRERRKDAAEQYQKVLEKVKETETFKEIEITENKINYSKHPSNMTFSELLENTTPEKIRERVKAMEQSGRHKSTMTSTRVGDRTAIITTDDLGRDWVRYE